MKQSIISNNFRKMSSLLIIALTASALFSSCKKDDTTADTVSDDEVAEAVSQSVSSGSGGIAEQSENSARMGSTTALNCGYTNDTLVTGQNLAGALITYNYSLSFNRALICTNGVPSQFDFNFAGSSSYTAPRMSSSDNSTAQFIITGVQPLSTNYILNENYVRNGTQQSRVRNQRSFSSTITITSTNITVPKSAMKITSGTATVLCTATVSGGAPVSRGGTITFLGNNQASLALNNGNTYPIQW